jgi:hypothetical protein
MIDPRQYALAGFGITLFYEAVDEIVRQAVAFDDHEALRLSKRGRRADDDEQQSQTERAQIAATGATFHV